jgi:predicted DsbA family dithiol-disulfide isomerase
LRHARGIWGDIACPWCYIGQARFEEGLAAFTHRDEIEVVYRSFELEPGWDNRRTELVSDWLANKYRGTREAMAAQERHVAAARSAGLDYRAVGRDNGNTFNLHRLLHFAKSRGRQMELLSRPGR